MPLCDVSELVEATVRRKMRFCALRYVVVLNCVLIFGLGRALVRTLITIQTQRADKTSECAFCDE